MGKRRTVSNIEIDTQLKTAKFKTGMNEVVDTVKKGVTDTNASLKKIGDSLSWQKLANQIRVGKTLFETLKSVGQSINQIFEKGDKVSSVSLAFQEMQDHAGLLASDSLTKLRNATQGLVSDFDLMTKANHAVTLGLDPKKFDEIAGAATKLGRALGIDTLTALDSLVTGLGRESVLRLDNLGIVVDTNEAYKKYAANIGIAVEALTAEQKGLAFKEEAIRKITEASAGLSEIPKNAGVEWTQFGIIVDNAFANFSKGVVESQQLGDALNDLGSSVTSLNDSGWERLGAHVAKEFVVIQEACGFLFTAFYELSGFITSTVIVAFSELFNNIKIKIDEAILGVSKFVDILHSVSDFLGENTNPINFFTKIGEDAAKGFEIIKNSVADTTTSISERFATALGLEKELTTGKENINKFLESITEVAAKAGGASVESFKLSWANIPNVVKEQFGVTVKAIEDSVGTLNQNIAKIDTKAIIESFNDINSAIEYQEKELTTTANSAKRYEEALASLKKIEIELAEEIRKSNLVLTSEGIDDRVKNTDRYKKALEDLIEKEKIYNQQQNLSILKDRARTSELKRQELELDKIKEKERKETEKTERETGKEAERAREKAEREAEIIQREKERIYEDIAQHQSDIMEDNIREWGYVMEGAFDKAFINSTDDLSRILQSVGIDFSKSLLAASFDFGKSLSETTLDLGKAVSDIFSDDIQTPYASNLEALKVASLEFVESLGSQLLMSSVGNIASGKGGTQDIATTGGGVIGGVIGSAFGNPMLGMSIGSSIGSVIGGLIKEGADPGSKMRKEIEKSIEEKIKGVGGFSFLTDRFDIKFAHDSEQFATSTDQNWADAFRNIAGEGVAAFTALGEAIAGLAGGTADYGNQIGFIIARSIGGEIDNARLMVQALGLSVEDFTETLLNSARRGEVSWHQFETSMQQVTNLTGEGLIGVGDLTGAYTQLSRSGGMGVEALISLQNMATEAIELGVVTAEQFGATLIEQGILSAEQWSAFAEILETRGIRTMEDLTNASDRTLGGIIADLDSNEMLFEEWKLATSEIGDSLAEIKDNLKFLDDTDFKTKLDVEVAYKATGDIPEGLSDNPIEKAFSNLNTNFDLETPTTKNLDLSNRIYSPESLKSFVINVNAPNAAHGVEASITRALTAMRSKIVNEAVSLARRA